MREPAHSRERAPRPPVSATANTLEASRPIVAIGSMEYCLGKDGDVLHRMAGNVTSLDATNPFWGRLPCDEKLALEMLPKLYLRKTKKRFNPTPTGGCPRDPRPGTFALTRRKQAP